MKVYFVAINKIPLKIFLFYFFCVSTIAYQFIGFIGSEWMPISGSTSFQMPFKQSVASLVVNVFCFALILLLFISVLVEKIKLNNKLKLWFFLYSIGLILFGLFWLIIAINEYGISTFRYNGNPSLLIFLGVSLFIGSDTHLWKEMLKITKLLTIFYFIVTLIYIIQFETVYLNHRMGSGPIFKYFSILIFLTAIIMCSYQEAKINKVMFYTLLCGNLIIAVLTVSRGWLLQAILLILFSYIKLSQKSMIHKIKDLLVLIIVAFVSYYVLTSFFSNAFIEIASRLYEDTRSSQLSQFFQQIKATEMLTGQGVGAMWIYNGALYSYIDNQFIFFIFRYGIVPSAILFFALFRGIRTGLLNKKNSQTWSYRPLFLMLMLALNGLSIYFDIDITVCFMFSMMIIGHLSELNERVLD